MTAPGLTSRIRRAAGQHVAQGGAAAGRGRGCPVTLAPSCLKKPLAMRHGEGHAVGGDAVVADDDVLGTGGAGQRQAQYGLPRRRISAIPLNVFCMASLALPARIGDAPSFLRGEGEPAACGLASGSGISTDDARHSDPHHERRGRPASMAC